MPPLVKKAALALAALLVLAVSAGAQNAPSEDIPVFRSRSELVTVPVVVTDKKGDPVEHLTKDDFVLIEDGKQQKIASFDEVMRGVGAQKTPDTSTPNSPTPRAVPPNITILVLDLVNTPFEAQSRSAEQMLKYVQDAVDESQPTALFVINWKGLTQIHDFTVDPKVLAKALKKVRGGQAMVEQANQEAIPAGTPPELAALLEDIRHSEQRMESVERVQAIGITMRSLRQIAQHCAGLPGRKSLIWASGGFPFNVNETNMVLQVDAPALEGLPDVVDLYRRTWQDLNQAQVALYPVDAAGLTVSNLPDVTVRNPRPEAFTHGNWMHSDTVATFRTFAEATGGRAFYDTNGLTDAFHRASDDSNHYYVLSYYLDRTGKKEGWHKLRVKVQREGLQLRARNGFFLNSPIDEKSKEVALNIAIQSPINSTGISIQGSWKRTLPSPHAGKKRQEFVLTMPANFAVIDEADNNHMKVEFVAVAMTAKGTVAGQVGRTMDAHLQAVALKQVRESGMDYRDVLDLPPGEYSVHFVVQDKLTGQLGSVLAPLKIAR